MNPVFGQSSWIMSCGQQTMPVMKSCPGYSTKGTFRVVSSINLHLLSRDRLSHWSWSSSLLLVWLCSMPRWPLSCFQNWGYRHTMLSSGSRGELTPHAGTAGANHLSCCPVLSTIYHMLFLIIAVTSRKPPALTNYCISAMNTLSIFSSRYGYNITPFCAQNSQGHFSNNGCALSGVPAEWCMHARKQPFW